MSKETKSIFDQHKSNNLPLKNPMLSLSFCPTAASSDLKLIEKHNDSNSSVYLVYSIKEMSYMAMKVFPIKDGKKSQHYLNESRFSELQHPNIIKTIKPIDSQRASLGNIEFDSSCILLELAQCDIYNIIGLPEFHSDETLVRTYFHHLIEGLEYLQSQGISHMDIKPKNLLLGNDYLLKIADFNQAYQKGEFSSYGRGTSGYRAPEIIHSSLERPEMADIYSCGILLFILQTGYAPYLEGKSVKGHDLQNLMLFNSKTFWEIHRKIIKNPNRINNDFIELINSMVRPNPKTRASIKEIKSNIWFQGPVYAHDELRKVMELVLEGNILNKF